MRFVPVKSADAQSVLMLHRARHLLVRQRTAQVSAMRAHLAEYGIVAPKGRAHVRDLVAALDSATGLLPNLAHQTLLLIARMIESLSAQIRKIEIELMAWHRATPACRRLETIPGIGFITATALVATVSDARAFRSGRQFAAWLGLVPRQNSSGGKNRLGGISRMGDRYLPGCVEHLARGGDKPALLFPNGWMIRYAELAQRVERQQFGSGKRLVAIDARLSEHAIIAYLAAL